MQTAFVSIIPSKNCRHNVLVNWLSSVENITRLMYSQIKHTNCILCENGKKPLIGILIMYGERRAGGRRKWVRQFPMYFHSGCSCRKHNLDDTCIFHYIMWVEMGHPVMKLKKKLWEIQKLLLYDHDTCNQTAKINAKTIQTGYTLELRLPSLY